MELLSVSLARALWFINAQDVNPRGVSLLKLFPALVERYKFVGYPRLEDLIKPDREPGERFVRGEFKNSEGTLVAVDLGSFDDGLMADTRSSTTDSEAFLAELAEWLVQDFGLTFRPHMIRRRAYVSELYVSSTRPLDGLTSELGRFAKKISSLITGSDETMRFEPSGISFSVDPASTLLRPAHFILERAVEIPHAEERYYSRAPLSTETHMELLDELEKILMAD